MSYGCLKGRLYCDSQSSDVLKSVSGQDNPKAVLGQNYLLWLEMVQESTNGGKECPAPRGPGHLPIMSRLVLAVVMAVLRLLSMRWHLDGLVSLGKHRYIVLQGISVP